MVDPDMLDPIDPSPDPEQYPEPERPEARARTDRRTGQAFVAGPKGRKPTRAEVEKMAEALWEQINKGK